MLFEYQTEMAVGEQVSCFLSPTRGDRGTNRGSEHSDDTFVVTTEVMLSSILQRTCLGARTRNGLLC